MRQVIIRRLLTALPTALFGSVLIFLLVHIIPGGVAETLAGPEASPEMVAVINEQLGLNRPLHEQYFDWLGKAVQGNFGHSLLDNRDIGQGIADRFPLTMELAAIALFISLLVGVPLGVLSAVKRHTAVDSAVTSVSGLGLALPEFWIAMLAVNLLALRYTIFPATGIVPISEDFWGHVNSMVMPALTLATGATAAITRFTRSGMIDALNSNYIRTAWALGLPARQVLFSFALRNALIPVITVVGIVAGSLIGGAVLVEEVFVIPGVGALLVTGVLQKDFPTVQGVALVLTVAVIVINLTVDLTCAAIDPRTRR
jgi:peptide/nickel transport system permease protein